MKSKRLAFLGIAGTCLMLGATLACAGEDSIATLVGALPSADKSAQLRAIDELGARGEKAAEAVAPLTQLLKNDSAAVRAHAAHALGEIGEDEGASSPWRNRPAIMSGMPCLDFIESATSADPASNCWRSSRRG